MILFIVYSCLCHVSQPVMYTVYSQDIDLSEALCGFTKIVKTLDDRDLVIMSHSGDVIKHGMSTKESCTNMIVWCIVYCMQDIGTRSNLLG